MWILGNMQKRCFSEITVYGVLHNDRLDAQLTCSHLNRNLFYRRRGTVYVTNVSDF